ncbi:transposase, partial [Klebsiella michiganensis]
IAAERAAKASGRSHQVHMPMYFVQIDSHVLDVLVVDESTREVMGRPTLVLAIDVRTRCIVGWHLSMHPPSTVATLAVVKDMFTRPLRGLPGGICVHLIPDNGTEFKNSAVMRLLLKANVIIEPAAVREPNHKPHVESFFRTLTRSLVQTLPGTTFSNP